MDKLNYWEECLASSFEEYGIMVTSEQLRAIAEDVEAGHDNYGMAFYSPPSSDRISNIEREWKQRFDNLQHKFDKYRGNAEIAVKKALKQYDDVNVSIGEYGEVLRFDGRTERIQ